MPTFLLTEIITAERLLIAVGWTIIVISGAPCMFNVFAGDVRKNELWMATISLIGIGLLIFQYRALLGLIPVTPDPWVAIALGMFVLAGICVFAIRILRAPPEIQRGLVMVSLLAFLSLVAAGVLAA